MPSRTEKQWQHHETNKAMRKVRKQIKRNRKTKRTRTKNWRTLSPLGVSGNLDDVDGLYDYDCAESERVMPRGERARRQLLMKRALVSLREEEAEAHTSEPPTVAGVQGTVTQVSSGLCRVQVDDQELVCGIRGSLSAEDTGYTNVVAVGDEVIASEDGAGGGIVEAVLPRTSVLARPDVFHGHLQQVIVANAHQVLVVASWRDPPLWPELLDRYLIAAERSGLTPIVCINKTDLAEDISACRGALRPYLGLRYRVLLTSALTGKGVGRLREILRDKTTVLAGMSGVGKSSLLNAVQQGLELRTAQVSDYSHTGRHTTAQVNLLRLEIGGYVVDTPGIREFGVTGLRRRDLIDFYPELTAMDGQCRFKNCSHTHEPGCAVRAAVSQEPELETRYRSYQQIYKSLPESQAQQQAQAVERAWR